MARYAVDEALRAKILSIPGVAAVVNDRIYADDAAPQSPTYPYGLTKLIGDAGRFRKLAGVNKTVRTRYQIDFFGPVKSVVRGLAALVTATRQDGGMDGFQGPINSEAGAVYVQACSVENTRHESENNQSGGEARTYNAGFDLVIVFNE